MEAGNGTGGLPINGGHRKSLCLYPITRSGRLNVSHSQTRHSGWYGVPTFSRRIWQALTHFSVSDKVPDFEPFVDANRRIRSPFGLLDDHSGVIFSSVSPLSVVPSRPGRLARSDAQELSGTNRWFQRWAAEHPDDRQVERQRDFLIQKRGASFTMTPARLCGQRRVPQAASARFVPGVGFGVLRATTLSRPRAHRTWSPSGRSDILGVKVGSKFTRTSAGSPPFESTCSHLYVGPIRHENGLCCSAQTLPDTSSQHLAGQRRLTRIRKVTSCKCCVGEF